MDLAARHGADPEVFTRVPFAFYRKSIAAACAILSARRTGDAAAEAEAVAAAYNLWCEYKLAPRGLPPPSAHPRRLPDGLTLLLPFAERADLSGGGGGGGGEEAAAAATAATAARVDELSLVELH